MSDMDDFNKLPPEPGKPIVSSKFRSKRAKSISYIGAGLFVILFAFIGVRLLTGSHAASSYISLNADKGAVANGATVQACAGASDGNCVKFGGASGGGNPSCTKTISAGTDIGSTVSGSSAGAVICLNPGTYSAPSISKGGVSGNPITITSATPSNPALISGRTVIATGANYLNVNHLKFKWNSSASIDVAVALGTAHVNFVHNDVDGADGAICLTGSNYGSGIFSYTLIDHNTIHNCNGSASGHQPNEAQGIYLEGGPGDVITNNWCWAVSARCFQVRGENGGSWHNNVSDDSGQGWILGDVAPTSNNNMYNNVVGTVKGNSANGASSFSDYNAPVGSSFSGNSFHDNCVSKAPGPITSTSVSNNTVVTVQFVNAAGHNYNLSSASVNDPCRAFAVQGGDPGP